MNRGKRWIEGLMRIIFLRFSPPLAPPTSPPLAMSIFGKIIIRNILCVASDVGTSANNMHFENKLFLQIMKVRRKATEELIISVQKAEKEKIMYI